MKCAKIALSAATFAIALPSEGHIPVRAQNPQSIAQAQGLTRMAEPLP